MLMRNRGIVAPRSSVLHLNPRSLVLPRDASKDPNVLLPHQPVNRDWTTGQPGVSRTPPKVTEDRVDGELKGLCLSGDISTLPGGYEQVLGKYVDADELSSLERIEFRDTIPSSDDVSEAVCGLVAHSSKIKKFSLHNCGAPSHEGWMKLLCRTQGWKNLLKFRHTGDNHATVLISSEAAYQIPAVPGIDDHALVTMARHVATRRPWTELEELTLEKIVYPVHVEPENPDESFYIQTDGRDQIEEFASHVWMKLKTLNLDAKGLDTWTRPADLCKPV